MYNVYDQSQQKIRSTTVLCIHRPEGVVLIADGQVSLGNTVIKSSAEKVKRIGKNKDILCGFAGSTADCITLLDKLEGVLEQYSSQLSRACVELAKDWRTNRMMQKLEAMMIVADREEIFVLTGSGDVLQPEKGVAAIGSGGHYALSAARALLDLTGDVKHNISVEQVAYRAMNIAAEICVYTNNSFTVEKLMPGDKPLISDDSALSKT